MLNIAIFCVIISQRPMKLACHMCDGRIKNYFYNSGHVCVLKKCNSLSLTKNISRKAMLYALVSTLFIIAQQLGQYNFGIGSFIVNDCDHFVQPLIMESPRCSKHFNLKNLVK